MSITKYEVFLKSAQLGNFTRAAEELNITQSGVSHTVAALEKELGLNLLVRSKGGVTLTADGTALLPHVQAVCEEERRLLEKAQELRGLDTGTIRIASFTSVAVKWLPKLLKSFHDLHPGVEFRLITAHDDRQTERMVMNGEADCGFLCLPAELSVDCEILHEDRWKVILPPGHPLAGQAVFPAKALAKETFIMPEEGDDHEVSEILEKLGTQSPQVYTVQGDETILAMVSAGLGIGIMPELMLQDCAYPLAACDLPGDYIRRIAVCVKDRSAVSLSTQRFLAYTGTWVEMFCKNKGDRNDLAHC